LYDRIPPPPTTPLFPYTTLFRSAEGGADLYPRLAPTFEWDIAAGDALLAAAGGVVKKPDGTPLRYGQIADGFRVPAFLAFGDPRSEEHTSELQSRGHLVCRLLLE